MLTHLLFKRLGGKYGRVANTFKEQMEMSTQLKVSQQKLNVTLKCELRGSGCLLSVSLIVAKDIHFQGITCLMNAARIIKP